MQTHRNRLAGGALAALVITASAAADDPGPDRLDVFGGREQALAAFRAMPQPRLEAVFLECDRVARDHMLGFSEGVQCAMAHDALLQRRFGGDFRALLAWWREQRAR